MSHQNNAFHGSWGVTVSPAQQPPIRSLGTFGADGTVVASPQPVLPRPGAPAEVVFTSAGHGAWKATGPNAAILTFVVLMGDGQGNLFGTNTVRGRVALGADGQSFNGEVVWTFADPGGATMATFPGTVQAERIVAEAPGTSTACPPSGATSAA